MIKLNGKHQRINIEIAAYRMGQDLCVLITGGDTPHLGALSAASPNMEIQTIAFDTHKEYHVTEMATKLIQKSFNGNFVVCCGIHLDNIEKHEITDVMVLAEELVRELCAELKKGSGE